MIGDELGERLGVVKIWLVWIVLDLDIDPHARTRIQRIVKLRNVSGNLVGLDSTDNATVGEVRIVVHNHASVFRQPDIKFHCIGTHLLRPVESRDCVLLLDT